MTQLHQLVRNKLLAAQLEPREYYNRQRRPELNLQSGDIVWLLPRNIKTTRPSKKLYQMKIRPFNILVKIGTSAYKLTLPLSIPIHHTFHISVLEPYQENRFPSHLKGDPLLFMCKEKVNMDKTKSASLNSTATNYNTGLSRKAINHCTTRFGTRQKT